MPDVNSIPSSRRASTNMPPPAVPTSPSLNILPSNQPALLHQTSAALPSPPLPAQMAPPPAPGQDNTGVGAGPGPIRHPRPLTAADLHQQLEAEQELLVNRLTRDLTMLRAAHNSSVVSNASSTSASASGEPAQHPSSFTDTHLLSGPGFPIPSTSADRRHHRTSSSTSARSFNQTSTVGAAPAPIPIGHPQSGSASILEAARNPRGAPSMSRQNSTTSHRSRSGTRARSPAPGSFAGSYTQGHGFLHDPSNPLAGGAGPGHLPRSIPSTAAATPGSELSPGLLPATLRYEETAFYRQELEVAKRENEALKRRVKELEKMFRERRESDASRGSGGGGARLRSGSESTVASVSVSGAGGVGGGGTGIAGGRRDGGRHMERVVSSISVAGSVGVGVPEEELKVGESAASAGLKPEDKESK